MDCHSATGIADSTPPRPATMGLDELFALHAGELRRYAQRIVRTRDIAEDVVQDVFLRLWLRRDSLELGGGMRSYLFLTTRARALDALQRARRTSRAEASAEEGDEWREPAVHQAEGDAADVAPVPDAIAHAVAAVLATMPPRQRAVATRRLHDRRATADIARELGISPRTVEVHVARATKALRTQLPGLLASHR